MTRVDGALGVLADRLLRGGLLDSVPRVVLASLLLQTPLFALAYVQSNTRVAIGFFAAAVFAMALQGALQGLSIQLLAPARMRGLTMAIYLMSAAPDLGFRRSRSCRGSRSVPAAILPFAVRRPPEKSTIG